MTRPHSNNHKKGWRFALMPPWASGHTGAREGRPWVAHNTIHSATNVHNQMTDTTVLNNLHGSGAVLSPVSSDRIQQRTEQVVQCRQGVHGQFVGSRKQQRQRTQGNTPGRRTRLKCEEFIDKVQNEIVHLVEVEQCPAQNPLNTSSTQWR